jgi:Domain of unknown function (DUF932)
MAKEFLTTITLPSRGYHTKEREQKIDPFFEVKEVEAVRADTGVGYGDRYLINPALPVGKDKVGSVSSRYHVTTHREASDLVKGILDRAGLEYESKGARVSNKGSRFFEDIVFPSLAFNPASTLESTALDTQGMKVDDYFPRITIMNSYDKTRPVLFLYGMYRLRCTNGACLPIKVTKLSFRHTQEVNVERVKNELVQSLEDSRILMQRVYDRLNKEAGMEYLAKVFTGGFSDKFLKLLSDKLNAEDSTYHIDYEEITNPKTGKPSEMRVRSVTTKASAYAIYNVVTDIASHVLTDRAKQETANATIARLFIAA